MIRLQGQNYDSLQDYYKLKHGVSVGPEEPVAKVSFRGIDRAQPVLARALRLRVANESLPNELKNVDKVAPKDRCAEIEKLLDTIGVIDLLARAFPKSRVASGVHCRIRRFFLNAPDLAFANGRILQAPLNGNVDDRRAYYRERKTFLNEVGCLHVPPALTRVLHVAVPEKSGEAIANQLAENITERLSKWTRMEIVPEVVTL